MQLLSMTLMHSIKHFSKERGKIIPLSSEWSKCSLFVLDQKYNMSHLTESQRYAIRLYLDQGYKKSAIAKLIGKDKSVITREIKRNSDGRSGQYREDLAQRKYVNRLKQKKKRIKLTEEVEQYIISKLKEYHSPEQISQRAKKDNIGLVSHETIYKYIYNDKKKGGDLYKYLRKKRRYKSRLVGKDKRGKIPKGISIEQRPEVVKEKLRYGDLEIDTVIGKCHKGAIVTINDRATRLVRLIKIETKESKYLTEKTIEVLMKHKEMLKTITSDNGKEFAGHEQIAKALSIDFYFADPYCSWQRGANENTNGLLRQYFPKKSTFDHITQEMLNEIEMQLNNRPRKVLNYNTPLEQFYLLTKVAFVA